MRVADPPASGDIELMRVADPPASGDIELMRGALPGVPLILLFDHEDFENFAEGLRRGASGLVAITMDQAQTKGTPPALSPQSVEDRRVSHQVSRNVHGAVGMAMSRTRDAPASFARDGLAWRAAGAGHPVLLLHGIPDSARAWDGVVAGLASRHRCLAPDLPGLGASAPPAALAGLEDVRAIMDAIVATLELPHRFTLVVHDVGGVFGLAWAVARPERVRRLVVLNTSVFADRRWHWGARILRTPLLGDVAIRFLPRRAFRAHMRRASNHNLTDAQIDATLKDFGPAARRTALRLYRMQDPGLFCGLPQAVCALTRDVPALVIWGRRDPYLPARFAERFGAGTVRVHPRLGHWPHREAPDQVAAEIDVFLAASAASGLRAE